MCAHTCAQETLSNRLIHACTGEPSSTPTLCSTSVCASSSGWANSPTCPLQSRSGPSRLLCMHAFERAGGLVTAHMCAHACMHAWMHVRALPSVRPSVRPFIYLSIHHAHAYKTHMYAHTILPPGTLRLRGQAMSARLTMSQCASTQAMAVRRMWSRLLVASHSIRGRCGCMHVPSTCCARGRLFRAGACMLM